MNKVLVTSIGSSSAKTVIESLKKENFVVIGCDINDGKYLYSFSFVDKFFKAPYYDDPYYLSFIRTIIEEEDIDIIIPLTDPEVDFFNVIKKELKCLVCIPNEAVIKVARNKFLLSEFMERCFPFNKIPTINSLEKINELDFPIIAKPINGRSSQGIQILKNFESLDKKDLYNNYIFQTYIDGDIFTVDVVRDTSGQVIIIPRREVIRTAHGLGLSVIMEWDKSLEELAIDIAKSLNLIGCVNMEFIKSGLKYYLIEINPRFSGGIGFTKIYGYDIVKNSITAYSKGCIEPFYRKEKITIVKEYQEYIYNK